MNESIGHGAEELNALTEQIIGAAMEVIVRWAQVC